MRNSRLLIAAAGLLLFGTANAQEPARVYQPQADHVMRVPGNGRVSPGNIQHVNSSVSGAALEFTVLDSLVNAFSFFSSEAQPIVWDPASNLTVAIMRGSPALPAGDGNNIYIRTSTDRGRTWGARIGPLNDPTVDAPGRYPSVAISNPTNSTNLSDILLFYTFPILTGPAGAFGGFTSGVVSATGEGGPLLVLSNTGQDDLLYGSDSKPVVVGNGTVGVTIGRLPSENSYSVRRFGFESGEETRFTPSAFADEAFRPRTAVGLFHTPLGLDKDVNENLYAGFLAYPADFTETTRLRPAVSKSTDDGETWSDLELPSENLIPDYIVSLGYDKMDSIFFEYEGDFTVTGPDRYHFVTAFQAFNAEHPNRPNIRQIVDISRDNGTWSIQKVVDIPFLDVLVIADDSDTLTSSQTGIEIQLERTADNSRLLVKYIDFFQYLVEGDFDGDGDGDATNPDTTQVTTDIMVTSRAVNGGVYSRPLNLTEDVFFDRLSWIPNVLPNDLRDVPLLTVQASLTGEEVADSGRFIASQLYVDRNTQFITIAQFDASSTTSVRANAAVAAGALRIFPNPAGAQALASFSIPSAGSVSLRIHDVTGSEIMSVPASQMSAGTHSIPFNTAALNSGVYYYTVTFNGTTSTTMFTVAR